jgi:hypothetical protein
MTKWSDLPREDLREIPAMVEAGWKPAFDQGDVKRERVTPDNVPHWPVSFVKDVRRAWRIYGTGEERWQVADLVNDRYGNYRSYASLEALRDGET